MAGEDFQQQNDLMARDMTPHVRADAPDGVVTTPASGIPVGRRISFVAWGMAGVTGIALWALIYRIV